MKRYALYLDADLNRVFTGALLQIAKAELQIAVVDATDIAGITQGRSQQLHFSSELPVDELRAIVGQLSAASALFEQCGDPGDETLRPIPIADRLTFGTDLVTTQRYRGKTNERFTRAMVNATLATAGIDLSQPTGTLLDPMCGRGTTLNWALAYGLHAIGIDADRNSLDHHATFLETWAKRSRLPHKMQRNRRGNAEQRSFRFEVGVDRAAMKAGGQRVDTFHADAADRSLAIKRDSVDVIVSDLPYGIQHQGSTAEADQHRPGTVELLEACLPTWKRWLVADGAIGIAWNTKRASRAVLGETLRAAGFEPLGEHTSMQHTVDASIDRDVLIAKL